MRKFIRITALITVAAIAIYGIGRVTGPSVYTEIEIAAAAPAVWAVLADTEGHADWNPLIISMEGEVKDSAPLRNVMRLPGPSPMELTRRVPVAPPGDSVHP